MDHTWGSGHFMTWPTLSQQLRRRPSSSPSSTQHTTTSPITFDPTVPLRHHPQSSTKTYFFTRSGLTSSTVWGPGALTGKLLKHLGEKVEGLAEYLVIRTKLNQMEKMQPNLLGSVRELSEDEIEEMVDQCEKLVELCIVGMRYRPAFMTRAFSILLSGFQCPGRKIWTYHIAEAISKRRKIEVFGIFQDCFFFLLDESIFRIEGVVDLQTLSFRCPAVAHEIAAIISHLARKDRNLPVLQEHSEPLNVDDGNPPEIAEEDSVSIKANFSTVIIKAGFLRLVAHWVEHGLPHWDVRGKARLEEALQDVADSQISCGDLEKYSEEAIDLIRKLRGRRLLLDEVTDVMETHQLDFEIEEASQLTL
ncbi:hypothetical protein JB92DRAFT_2871902 [Gautieria morchelliformis]|nr:hypothetical protein JB92DRAFT_2871902 [Gautieria morchelliformis]